MAKTTANHGDPRVKDPATREALGFRSHHGIWKDGAKETTYVPREGVKVGYAKPKMNPRKGHR